MILFFCVFPVFWILHCVSMCFRSTEMSVKLMDNILALFNFFKQCIFFCHCECDPHSDSSSSNPKWKCHGNKCARALFKARDCVTQLYLIKNNSLRTNMCETSDIMQWKDALIRHTSRSVTISYIYCTRFIFSPSQTVIKL